MGVADIAFPDEASQAAETMNSQRGMARIVAQQFYFGLDYALHLRRKRFPIADKFVCRRDLGSEIDEVDRIGGVTLVFHFTPFI